MAGLITNCCRNFPSFFVEFRPGRGRDIKLFSSSSNIIALFLSRAVLALRLNTGSGHQADGRPYKMGLHPYRSVLQPLGIPYAEVEHTTHAQQSFTEVTTGLASVSFQSMPSSPDSGFNRQVTTPSPACLSTYLLQEGEAKADTRILRFDRPVALAFAVRR
jgi:hypothetical protein